MEEKDDGEKGESGCKLVWDKLKEAEKIDKVSERERTLKEEKIMAVAEGS